ncbi:MAG: hypothetical protein ACREP9_19920, partial [Candidatus Dormibacteraceae bacterium]
IVFDQMAATPIARDLPLSSGTYQPADYQNGPFDFPAPCPPGPYTNTLLCLNNESPNGAWSLYAIDDALGEFGAISDGWGVMIRTQPAMLGLTGATMVANSTLTIPFTVRDETPSGSELSFQGISSNPDLIRSTNITFGLDPAHPSVNLAPVPGATGTAEVTVVVGYDQGLSVGSTFTLVVANDTNTFEPPRIFISTNVAYVAQNTETTITYTVTDPDTSLTPENFSVSSLNPEVVGNLPESLFLNASAIPMGTTGTVSVVVRPSVNAVGSATIVLSVTDGRSVASSSVMVNVFHPAPPPGPCATNFLNSFDTAPSVDSWGTQWSSPVPTLAWDGSEDADGNTNSGCLRLTENFTGGSGEWFMIVGSFYPGWGWDGTGLLNESNYVRVRFDLRVPPGTPPTRNGDYGSYALSLSPGIPGVTNIAFFTLPYANDWLHFSFRLDPKLNPSLTNLGILNGFNLQTWYQGEFTNSITLLLDNLRFEVSTGFPPNMVGQPMSQTVPAGSGVRFSVAVDSIEPVGFQWYLNGSPMSGGTGPN